MSPGDLLYRPEPLTPIADEIDKIAAELVTAAKAAVERSVRLEALANTLLDALIDITERPGPRTPEWETAFSVLNDTLDERKALTVGKV